MRIGLFRLFYCEENPMSEHTIDISKDTWQSEVLDSDQPVLVDFWAPWCGPCKALAPTLDQVAEALTGTAKVAKVNTDDNQEIAVEFGIRGIPTLLVFKGGEMVERVNDRSFEGIKSVLEGHVG